MFGNLLCLFGSWIFARCVFGFHCSLAADSSYITLPCAIYLLLCSQIRSRNCSNNYCSPTSLKRKCQVSNSKGLYCTISESAIIQPNNYSKFHLTFLFCSKLTKCVWAWWFRYRFTYCNTSTSISLLHAQSTVSVPRAPPAVLRTLLCCQKKTRNAIKEYDVR